MQPEGLAAAAAAAALFLRIHMGCVQNLHPEHGLLIVTELNEIRRAETNWEVWWHAVKSTCIVSNPGAMFASKINHIESLILARDGSMSF